MEELSFNEIVDAVKGKVYIRGLEEQAVSVSTDTRKIQDKSVFVALKGENFNGNDFIIEASKRGAAFCIVDEIKFEKKDIRSNTTVILVDNGKKALMDLARYYRMRLKIKVVAITGSTGKTSTKDLTAAALSGRYKVFKTQGNFNNEIGLPLMIFNLDNSYDVAILEMGMSNFGEIHNMAKAAQPDIALITNIGISHIENLKTQENILKAKLEITDFFDKNSVLIVNGDDKLLWTIKDERFEIIKAGTSSLNTCNPEAFNILIGEKYIDFDISRCEGLEHYHIELPGRHNVLNSMLAIACATKMGLSYEEICNGLNNLEATSMRLDIIKGNKITIINDCYNASPDSMKAAIDVLVNLKCKRRIAVLGTMKELGSHGYDAHKNIGIYAAKKKIDLLVTLGEYNNAFKEGFMQVESQGILKSFSNYDEAVEYVEKFITKEDAILVKASRSMKFETIANKLVEIND